MSKWGVSLCSRLSSLRPNWSVGGRQRDRRKRRRAARPAMRLTVSRIAWKARQSGINVLIREKQGVSRKISSRAVLGVEMDPHIRFGVDSPAMSTREMRKIGTQESGPKRKRLRLSKHQMCFSVDGLYIVLRYHMEAGGSIILEGKTA